MSENIVWHRHSVEKNDRSVQKSQKPCVLWFTGLSGAGKSTVASLVESLLVANGRHTYLLDGDNIRHGLCKDLGFTDVDRVENIRRIGEVSKLFVDAGVITLCAFISPFAKDRQVVRSLLNSGEFIEIFCDASLSECEKRDPKGLYKKARQGVIKNFTGIDSAYEKPIDPEVHLDCTNETPEELAMQVVNYLVDKQYLEQMPAVQKFA